MQVETPHMIAAIGFWPCFLEFLFTKIRLRPAEKVAGFLNGVQAVEDEKLN